MTIGHELATARFVSQREDALFLGAPGTGKSHLALGARDLGAGVELHYVSEPPEVLIGRIQRRGREDPPISHEAVSQWFKTFQAPTSEEMALFDITFEADPASDLT